ncbi:MAG: M4 family metallopeptidase [Nocardioidaceae bacterium]
MRAVRHFVTLLLICTGLAFVQGISSASTALEPAESLAAKPDPSLLQQLRNNARGSVGVTPEAGTSRAGFIAAGRNGDLLPSNDARAVDKAAAFMNTYGPLLGATGSSQLRQTGRSTDKYGTTVSYEQVYQGVPVFGGTLKAHIDDDGDLTAVNGTAVPNLSLSTTPRLSAQESGKRAVASVRSDPPTSEDGKAGSTAGIRAVSSELFVYRTGLISGEAGDNYLAYRVEVSNRANIRDIVILEANVGKVLNRYSMVENALERKLYEGSYSRNNLVWREGKKFPGKLSVDQQNIVEASGESYWFFKNAFGRDSYDGAGHVMESVNNDPRISCPNANWNGITTNYCNGVTSDDVVAHEWGHAYTEYTSGLIYQYQPGALNESYSDIWGETVDLINGRQDADEDNLTAKRGDGQCSSNTAANPVVVINTPESIARVCPAGAASFGPQLTATGVTDDVVQGLDVVEPATPGPPPTPTGTTTDACSPLTNGAEVADKIVIVDRGGCAFTQKATNVDATDARGLIIGNNVPGPPNGMSGVANVSIPVVQISQENRNAIVSQLANGVNVTMKDAGGEREDSFRWLVGEDSSAFGGAIRDMWTPTCLGDPGKVSDAEYKCSPDDQGGVHSNSGVPNHGYSLLVDGGTYNGQTINGIGLTKAAHIYWRAQDEYQTPTTDFVDHANALEQSCAALVGQTVNGLSTAGSPEDTDAPAPLPNEKVLAADCLEVTKMVAAVELRREPTQCNFEPMLDKNTPNVCGAGTTRSEVWSEDFEDGLTGWTLTNTGVYAGWPGTDWVADSEAPGNHPGGVAYAEDLDGSCGDPLGDVSGDMRLQSGSIVIPGVGSPVLQFEHYVATEASYDGGNLKVSVNDGTFEVVPASAYTFNPPNDTLATAAEGNTNPLEGEEAFTGTDGGEVSGSWGESQIDLTKIAVKSGDSIELQFDFGMDGCGNVDGWYVDNVSVSTCTPSAGVTAGVRR